MDSVRRASAALFYLLGLTMIVLVVLAYRGMIGSWAVLLNILDLPLVFIAMLFGGSSLYCSLSKGKASPVLLVIIFLPLAALFGFFCWANFGVPFAEIL